MTASRTETCRQKRTAQIVGRITKLLTARKELDNAEDSLRRALSLNIENGVFIATASTFEIPSTEDGIDIFIEDILAS